MSLNERPRETLDFEIPAERFNACVASDRLKWQAKAMGWTPPLLKGIYVPNWSCYIPANEKKESTMNKLNRVGIDLAKNIFQLHEFDRTETSTWCRRLKRDNWIKGLLNKVEPGCEIGMQACTGAHHWA